MEERVIHWSKVVANVAGSVGSAYGIATAAGLMGYARWMAVAMTVAGTLSGLVQSPPTKPAE